MEQIKYINFFLKTKLPLTIFLTIQIIYSAWDQIEFNHIMELVVFFPFMIYYFSYNKYQELVDYGIKINYFIYEFTIFIFLFGANIFSCIKVYADYYN